MRNARIAFVLGAALTLSAVGVAGALLVRAHVIECEAAYVAFSAWTAQNGAAPPPGQMPTCTSWTSMYPLLFVTFLVGLMGSIGAGLAMWVVATNRPASR